MDIFKQVQLRPRSDDTESTSHPFLDQFQYEVSSGDAIPISVLSSVQTALFCTSRCQVYCLINRVSHSNDHTIVHWAFCIIAPKPVLKAKLSALNRGPEAVARRFHLLINTSSEAFPCEK